MCIPLIGFLPMSTIQDTNFTKSALRRVVFPLLLAVLFAYVPSKVFAKDSVEEIQRSWDNGLVFWRESNNVSSGIISEELGNATQQAGSPNVIVYMHGCNGVGNAAKATGAFLASQGYLVVMPDSFARENKPESCDTTFHRGGKHRGVLEWRQNEANNAIRQVRQLARVNQNNVFLMGLSEGAITTATVSGEPVSARIIEGWTCHAGWHEYSGLNALASEPVLNLLGEEDPWFTAAPLRGHCGEYMQKDNGSLSVLFRPPHVLTDYHFLSWHASAQEVLLEFLARNSR